MNSFIYAIFTLLFAGFVLSIFGNGDPPRFGV